MNNNSDSSNNSEDKGFRAKNVSGNVTYTSTKGNHNIVTVSVGEKINTDSKVRSKQILNLVNLSQNLEIY